MENASLWRQKIEINTTQKILQSQLGISSAIFRAPYSDDHDPHTQKQLLPVKVASELGYLSVGMKINPNDWQVKSKDELGRVCKGRRGGYTAIQELGER